MRGLDFERQEPSCMAVKDFLTESVQGDDCGEGMKWDAVRTR